MIGYGPELSHFVIELTYNYGVKSYEYGKFNYFVVYINHYLTFISNCLFLIQGNDFKGITIKSKEVIERARQNNYPISIEDSFHVLRAPDGYTFYILNETQPIDSDPVIKVGISSTNLNISKKYWHDILGMKLIEENLNCVTLAYGENQVKLDLVHINDPLNRAKAYGRIAFAIPYDEQPTIDAKIKSINGKILTPLISLDTPGKATVRVIILADPDDHEICFVDDEGFSKLSEFDPEGDELLEKHIKRDPFQTK